MFPNPDPVSTESHPYFVVLQTNALEHLNTRIVAPLIAPRQIRFFKRLMPEVSVTGSNYVIDIANVGVIPTHLLKGTIANLEEHRERIIRAFDLVFLGI